MNGEWENEIILGNALDILRQMPDESIQCCVTSPPYWGLRDYGIEPVIWDGKEECPHEWGNTGGGLLHENRNFQEGSQEEVKAQDRKLTHIFKTDRIQSQFCSLCGAWRGSLGLEPAPELYVQHIVQIFREVKRVLRKDGTLWLNLGDSYYNSKSSPHPENQATNPNFIQKNNPHAAIDSPKNYKIPGLKTKNLVGIPWRVGFALQADGWWLRSDIIWHKPNPMPESVTDRPTRSHEYIFLLSKSAKYYYDADAIREAVTGNSHPRGDGVNPKAKSFGPNSRVDVDRDIAHLTAGRIKSKQNRSFSAAVHGLVFSRNCRSVWTFATAPFPGAHFATFPPELPRRCILAGSKEGDKVLDPFMGAGTVALVCEQLNRRWIGIELNPDYIEMANERLSPYRQQAKLALK